MPNDITPEKIGINYASPSLETRFIGQERGFGAFARAPIRAGELVAVWGGAILTGREVARLDGEQRSFSFQIDDDLFMTTLGRSRDAADFINHNCDPNTGISGQITLVALRDIEIGEEVCFDYAMTDASPFLEFRCQCGSPSCRGYVSADDWRSAELQKRYRGYFSSFLQRRIDEIERSTVWRPARKRSSVQRRLQVVPALSLKPGI
jgi:hypothetical protein